MLTSWAQPAEGAFHLRHKQQKTWAFHVNRKRIFNETTTAISAASLTPHRRSAATAKQQSRQSRRGRAAMRGLPKAHVMHKEFGAVSLEQRGNAWVRVKRGRDPCRGQSASSEVSGRVNGHDCSTQGCTRSRLVLCGCLHGLILYHLKARSSKLKQELIVSSRCNHHVIQNKPKHDVKKKTHVERLLLPLPLWLVVCTAGWRLTPV